MNRNRSWIVALAALPLAGCAEWFGTQGVTVDQGAEVKRGPLRISVIERGNLKAADYVSLKSEIEGQATILFLHPEGRQVEAGTLVCELDATSLIDKRVSQEISLRNAEAQFVESKQNYQIQISQNESDIANALQTLEFARQDLKKYLEGDRLLAEQKAAQEITLKTEEAARSKEQFDWSQKLAEKGFLTNTELEADRLARSRAEIMLDQATKERTLLVDYEVPRQIATFEADVKEAERELDRVKLQADARLTDYDTAMRTNEIKLKLEQEKLAKLDRQIAKAKIIAPKAGMVVYAKQEEGGRSFGTQQPIQEGTTVRERQEIITIPTAGGMIAQASLHESVLKQVEIGMPVEVSVDALRGQTYWGRVLTVAVLPDQNSWWANPNLRLYRCDIALENGTMEMRPGMSCSIEILCETVTDALYLPVQCVFRHKGENVVFPASQTPSESKPVVTGRFNEKWIEIKSGVVEGERLLLSLPEGFKLEGGGEEEEESAPPIEGLETAYGSPANGAGAARGESREAGANEGSPREAGAFPRGEGAGEGRRRRGGGENGSGSPGGRSRDSERTEDSTPSEDPKKDADGGGSKP